MFHLDHYVDFELGVLSRFEIEFYFHVVFYIIVNYFLKWVKSDLVTKSDKFRTIGSILNTFIETVN